jgi:hypothetical protein
VTAAATHEIDLIPSDYRHARAVYRTLRVCGIAIGVLVAAAGIAAGALHNATEASLAEVAELSKAVAMGEQQQAAIDALTQQKQALEAQAVLRSGLRARAPIDDFMTSIGSAAVGAGVWFRSWRFERLGAVVPAAPAGAESLFVVEPGASGRGVRSEILIAGRAPDAGCVSTLVQALVADERLAAVRVQRVSRDAVDGTVAFELALSSDYAGEAP